MSSITSKAIADITWADIERLIGVPEGTELEFKRDLAVPNGGGQHRWHRGEDLDRAAKDGIAREVVAFANAWGGTIILGVNEDKSTPRACSEIMPLPRVVTLADKLDSALRSLIDPPLAGLECRPVLKPDGDDEGIVVIRVNRSVLAPHGFGDPPASYVRRSSSATPMTMQDLHNLFWESRTRTARIEADRRKASAYLSDATHRFSLHRHCQASAPNPAQGVFFRFCAYPHASLELQDLDSRSMWVRTLRPEAHWLFERPAVVMPAGDGLINWSPRPIAHGIEIIDHKPARWLIRDNGSIEVFGFREGAKLGASESLIVSPEWFVSPAAQILTMIEIVRRRALRPGVPFEIDAEVHGQNVTAFAAGENHHQEARRLEGEPATVGPFIYRNEGSAEEVFRALEREIWRALGMANIKPLPVTLGRAVNQLAEQLELRAK